MTGRVAVVTGGNKGIGFAIVKALCQQYDGNVYLTARDITRGQNAVSELKKEGLQPKFHQLDITDDESIRKFRDYLKNTYGGLDVLVNNAAIAFRTNAKEPFALQAEETLRVNYFSLRRVCDELYPLLRPHARVVNLSSSAGRVHLIRSDALKKKLTDKNRTEAQVDELMRDFVNAAKDGHTHLELGWANSAYAVSKIGVSSLTAIHQAAFDADPREDIVVNACHPGYIVTDMTGHKGDDMPEAGAIAPVYCALLPENTKIKGEYIWCDKTISSWSEW